MQSRKKKPRKANKECAIRKIWVEIQAFPTCCGRGTCGLHGLPTPLGCSGASRQMVWRAPQLCLHFPTVLVTLHGQPGNRHLQGRAGPPLLLFPTIIPNILVFKITWGNTQTENKI